MPLSPLIIGKVLYFLVVFEPRGLLSFEDIVIFTDLVDAILKRDYFLAFLGVVHIDYLHQIFTE